MSYPPGRFPLSRGMFLAWALFFFACASPPASEVFPTPRQAATLQPTSRPTVTPYSRRVATLLPTASPVAYPSLTAFVLPSKTPTLSPFVYVFPIQPPQDGWYSLGEAAHGYPAVDIFAAEGTSFVAVTDGVVEYACSADLWNPQKPDDNRRGGIAVAIVGDDGFRYYGSHLSGLEAGIEPGVRVRAGQVLGYVGNSGDARNTPTHLHFGISRPSTPQDWHARRGEIDPFRYLDAWKAGIMLTPLLP